MPLSALTKPATDPTLIFEQFRNGYATDVLAVAVTDFNVFGRLAARAMTSAQLRDDLGLADRAATVLITALRAMGLIHVADGGKLELSPAAREHLVPGAYFEVGGYVGLVADAPDVRALAE